MVRLEWNALRMGDHVLVHDPNDAEMRLVAGVVALVDTARGSNDIGVRISSNGGPSSVARPARLTVHSDPRNLAEACWRCDAIAAAAPLAVAGNSAS
jgi:hypothetical protein